MNSSGDGSDSHRSWAWKVAIVAAVLLFLMRHGKSIEEKENTNIPTNRNFSPAVVLTEIVVVRTVQVVSTD